MTHAGAELDQIVEASLAREPGARIVAVAEAVRNGFGPSVVAVLAYGSCLRGVRAQDTLIDLYVLTDGFQAAGGSVLSRLGCRLLAPNVYYREVALSDAVYRCKCACVPMGRFTRAMGAHTPYFWARFAQPCAIMYARSDTDRAAVKAAIKAAINRMLCESRRLSMPDADSLTVWRNGFAATYATEFRSEGPERSRQIVSADSDYYQAVSRALTVWPDRARALKLVWWSRRVAGRCLQVLRLIKAAFTFRGGADYLAWKITRHSGVALELSDWQRKHPIAAFIMLAPKLLRSRAVR